MNLKKYQIKLVGVFGAIVLLFLGLVILAISLIAANQQAAGIKVIF